VLTVALITIAAVAVALAGVDRLLALIAVRQVARRLTTLLQATSAPAVRIAGVPFLTQLLSGTYRRVDVTVAAFRAGGIDIRGLTARLSQVRAPLRLMLAGGPMGGRGLPADRLAGGGLVAGEVSAIATIPLAAISERLPPGLVLRRQGTKFAISGFVMLMPVSGTLAIRADRQQIWVVPKMLGVPSLVGFVMTLTGLPPQLAIDKLRVTGAGLEITMRGENVVLGPG
jgi:hypothetical protein